MTEDEVVETSPVEEFAPVPESIQPVDVVTVDELLDRLTSETETAEEDPAAAEEELPVDTGPMEIAGMDQVLQHLETMEATMVHPALETPFEDYTVTEGLLLLLLVLVIVSWCVKMIKGGFSWLLW